MQYKANIDGLRALAVLAVIFFHAGFSAFPGGFVGVDIFFVISGYLIGSIIISETEANKFSFVNFYARRAGRILPALFFVMLISLPCAYFLLVPDQLKDFSKSLIYVSTFVSNMYFMKHLNYFDTSVELKPLIHTWSLSIEEQYYLIFPALMIMLATLQKYWRIIIITILATISFAILQKSLVNPTRAFYLFQTRCWELLLGVLVAYAHTLRCNDYFDSTTNNYPSYVGLALIIVAIIGLTSDYPYPSGYTLIPTVGTALILLSVSQKNFVNTLLSHQWLVGIGLISYSAYLWHQPLFAFARAMTLKDLSIEMVLILIGMTFLLAFLSWKYIERPCREFSRDHKRLALQISLVGCLFFIAIGAIGEKNNGYPQRYSLSESVVNQLNSKYAIWCEGICRIGDVSQKNDEIAMFGDSHAKSMANIFDRIGKEEKLGVVYSGMLGCPPFLGAYAEDSPRRVAECISRNNENFKYVRDHASIKKVFLVSRWTYYTDGDYFSRNIKPLRLISSGHSNTNPHENFALALRETVAAYRKIGVSVHIVSQAPFQKVDSETLYYQLSTKKLTEEKATQLIQKWSIDLKDHLALQSFVNDLFMRLAARDEIKFINMDSILCNLTFCSIGNPSLPFYSDNNHLSEGGALMTYPLFLKFIQD